MLQITYIFKPIISFECDVQIQEYNDIKAKKVSNMKSFILIRADTKVEIKELLRRWHLNKIF